jgi:hypothetical protein
MHGSTDGPEDARAEAERKLLAVLCRETPDADLRTAILRRLKDHQFADADHEVIYRALAAIPPVECADARLTLTQAVARLGFPDLELSFLFNDPLPTPGEIAALLERL